MVILSTREHDMTDQITLTQGGGSIHTGLAVNRVQALAVKHGLKALKISGKPLNRAYTAKNLLAMVAGWTGKTYKGAAKLDAAIADVEAIIAEMETKIEVVDERRPH